jgi:menaquinone-dependent protoporphyrinogen oxidase
MSRILIAYASSYGQTRKIAETIAANLRRRGHTVELAAALVNPPPPVQDYEAVVLGSPVQFGHHARPIIDYIIANRAALLEVPSYFFSVSMTAVNSQARDHGGYLDYLFATTQWLPSGVIALAGGLPYRRYGFFLRMIMKLISRRNGHTTDTSRNHEYTDWVQVRRFAAGIAADLVAPSVLATLPAAN